MGVEERERKLHGLKRKLAGKEKKLCSAESGLKDVGEKPNSPNETFDKRQKNGRRLVYSPQRALLSGRLGSGTNLFYKQRGKSHNCISRTIKSIKDAFGVGGTPTWRSRQPNSLSPAER